MLKTKTKNDLPIVICIPMSNLSLEKLNDGHSKGVGRGSSKNLLGTHQCNSRLLRGSFGCAVERGGGHGGKPVRPEQNPRIS